MGAGGRRRYQERGVQQTWLWGKATSHPVVDTLATLANLFMVCHRLVAII
jgi:hypothetical protein